MKFEKRKDRIKTNHITEYMYFTIKRKMCKALPVECYVSTESTLINSLLSKHFSLLPWIEAFENIRKILVSTNNFSYFSGNMKFTNVTKVPSSYPWQQSKTYRQQKVSHCSFGGIVILRNNDYIKLCLYCRLIINKSEGNQRMMLRIQKKNFRVKDE